MQKMMIAAVMVASFGFISAAHADNQLPSKSGAAISAASTTTTGTVVSSTGSSTGDQILVGGSDAAASQTSSNQDSLGQHDHGHDEDMD